MIANYTFMVFVLLCAVYSASFWFALDGRFLHFMSIACGVMACSIAAISAALFLTAIVFWILDGHLRIGIALWSVLRAAMSLALMALVYLLHTATTTGFEVHL